MTLREYRKTHGMTQAQMAQELGYSQAYISEAENGADVGREFIQKVMKVTGGKVPASVWFKSDEAA